MPNNEKASHRESPAERKRRWNTLKEKHGAPLEELVTAIRNPTSGISRIEARIIALSGHGYDIAATAVALGIDEQTVKNHRTDVRNTLGIPQEELAFDLIFKRFIPPSEKI